jgi:hypothetical protein
MCAALAVQQSILNKNRKDKFILVLNLPSILKRVNKADSNDRSTDTLNLDSLQYSIFGSVVPESKIPEVAVPYGAQVPKVTSYARAAYAPLTVNFTVDNQFNNWWVLWYWLNVINNSKQSTYNADQLNPTTALKTNLADYQANITVYGLDEYNNKKIQWDYTNAFITNLGEITYNYRDPDQMDSSFTFAFGQLNCELLD